MDAEGTDTAVGLDATRQELAEVQARMAQLKEEATAAVLAAWQSQWRNPDLVSLKVDTRLSGSQEYRALVARARAAEAALAAESAGGAG